jgi:hypothetical protein
MTKKTITTLSISSAYFVVFGLVLLYALITVQSQKAEAVSLRTTLAEQTTKQAAARTVETTIANTEVVRNELASFFLSEKETITFIADIEALASVLGVGVETTALDITRPAGGNAVLKTGFAVTGSRIAVINFMQALETLPYHSTLPTLRVSNQGDGEWQGQVEVLVTLAL